MIPTEGLARVMADTVAVSAVRQGQAHPDSAWRDWHFSLTKREEHRWETELQEVSLKVESRCLELSHYFSEKLRKFAVRVPRGGCYSSVWMDRLGNRGEENRPL